MLIGQKKILDGFEEFQAIASSGHNPRKFVSFNDSHLDKLTVLKNRKSLAKKFGIPLTSKNMFDAKVDGAAEKIVKLLCHRGMIDPFDDIPVEVSGSKKWS